MVPPIYGSVLFLPGTRLAVPRPFWPHAGPTSGSSTISVIVEFLNKVISCSCVYRSRPLGPYEWGERKKKPHNAYGVRFDAYDHYFQFLNKRFRFSISTFLPKLSTVSQE